jgi:hypothetical protein
MQYLLEYINEAAAAVENKMEVHEKIRCPVG